MRSKNKKLFFDRSGQGILEYVLLIALLSGLTFAFVNVIGKDVFGAGLKALPRKVEKCISHSPDPQSICGT